MWSECRISIWHLSAHFEPTSPPHCSHKYIGVSYMLGVYPLPGYVLEMLFRILFLCILCKLIFFLSLFWCGSPQLFEVGHCVDFQLMYVYIC